jgi:hypothetical protein
VAKKKNRVKKNRARKKYNLPTPADPKLSRAQDSPLQLTELLDAAIKKKNNLNNCT